jgi:uncharacterized protein (TIGR03437 family)
MRQEAQVPHRILRRIMKTSFAAVVVSMLLCMGQSPPPKIATIVGAAFGQRVAENSIATIFGSNLATSQAASAVPATTLGSTQVLLCGFASTAQGCQPLGLYFVSPGQINFVIPTNLSSIGLPAGTLPTGVPLTLVGGSAWNIAVNVSGILDANASTGTYFKLPIYQQAPDFFIVESEVLNDTTQKGNPPPMTIGRAAMIDQNGTVIDSRNPARMGQYLSVFMTGLGKIQANGQFASPGSFPAGSGTQVWITGYVIPWAFQAKVTFAGMSPQYPGLDQINFQVPTSFATAVPCGDQIIEPYLGVSPAGNARDVHFPIAITKGEAPCN